MQNITKIGIIHFCILVAINVSCGVVPDGFVEEEIEFLNNIDGAALAGTLTMPSEGGIFPAAVLISGSGPQDRDETIHGHKPFKVLAEFLTNQGIAILRFDDRGVGKSKGDVWNATLEILASDAYAGAQYLRTRREIDHNHIGLIGHSLGAMQGTILASEYDDISYLVMLGGLGIPWSENHIKADRLTNRLKGESDEIIEAGTQLLTPLLAAMKTAQDYQSARYTFMEIIEHWQSSLTGEAAREIKKFTSSNPDFWEKYIADEYATPIYLSCAKFEPYDYLSNIQCPVLSIIGEKDVQVVPENNLAIHKALKAGGNHNYKVIAPQNINHMFQKCESGLSSEYEKIDESFNKNLLILISGWINEITEN